MQVCLHMYVYIILNRLLHLYVICVGMFEGDEENPAQLSFLLKLPQEEVAQIMKDVTAETMEAASFAKCPYRWYKANIK